MTSPLAQGRTPEHPGAKTPFRLAPKRMDPAVHHHDLQGVLVQLVFRHSPHRAATIGGIRLLGSKDGKILPQPPAPNIGPAGDTRPLFNMGPREEPDPNNSDLYQSPTGLSLGYCEDFRGQEQQQGTRAGRGKPLCQATGTGLIMKVT